MSTITTADNTEIYVKDWDTGQPVILMHGWPLSSDSWDDGAMALVQAGYRTIAYDRRGFGRSSQPWRGYDYDTLADDLAAVLDQCGAKDAVLVGFSMGGGEVARYMSGHGGKSVAKAALIASVVPFMLKTADNPQGTEQAVFDGMAQTPFCRPYRAAPPVGHVAWLCPGCPNPGQREPDEPGCGAREFSGAVPGAEPRGQPRTGSEGTGVVSTEPRQALALASLRCVRHRTDACCCSQASSLQR